MRLLIIGNRGGTNIGECFERAALASGIQVRLLEARNAMEAPAWLRHFNWHIRRHRPTHLLRFSSDVADACEHWRPDVLLTTGLAPVAKPYLSRIRSRGVVALNYLTDDPWSRSHYAPWFLDALGEYDFVFSPRRANLAQLTARVPGRVEYLPFAYDESLHFAQPDHSTHAEACDVLFVGGADQDRIPFCTALIQAGIDLSLYGDYWNRYRAVRAYSRGYADPKLLRTVTRRARVCVCLVRRSNRDGHVMRTFEIPAMGGCMLTEETLEHRAIFGNDGEAVVYFRSPKEMADTAKWLLDHPDERQRLAQAAHRLITGGRNTYRDRLITMLYAAGVANRLSSAETQYSRSHTLSR